jgi:ABC-2 type transport system permease protein
MVRMALRRDRVRLPVWIVSITGMVLIVAVTFDDLYPTVEARVAIASTIGANPALRSVLGPIFDATSIGGLVAWRMSFASLVLVPLMAIFAVIRHTRAEEEAGRLELLGSTVLGRRAPLAAALIVACGASIVLGVSVGSSLVVYGEDIVGSVALGLSYALAGCAFAAVAGVAAQLVESARGASGLAVGFLGVSYLIRGVGDGTTEAGLSWLTWASPLGWVLEVRPFADERWWVAALLAVFTVVLIGASDVLVAWRDHGAGLVPSRPGSAEAAAWLRGPLGLGWRLHRGALLGWTAGLFALGAMYGGVAGGVGDVLSETPELEEIFRQIGGEQPLIDAFFATTMAIAGLITSGYVIAATLRIRSEETGLRAEQVLATSVGRTPWALSHVGIAMSGAAVLLAATGAGAGLTHGIRVGDVAGQVPLLMGAALVQLPAVLVLAGLALATVGLLPRITGIVWFALVAFLVLGQLGALLQLEQWLINLSPFAHLPAIPGGELEAEPLLALIAVAVLLGGAGIVGLRARDVG